MMKKFIFIAPLQPVKFDENGNVAENQLRKSIYKAVGNSKLVYDQSTRFPIIPVINGYVEKGEEIQVIVVVPNQDSARYHVDEFRQELRKLANEKEFSFGDDVLTVPVRYAGDVECQLEIFKKLLPCIEDEDTLFACLTYGNKPMPIAELMAIQYGYRVLENVSIGYLVYGELDHSSQKKEMKIFDITALIHVDELVRLLAQQKVKEPRHFLEAVLDLDAE